MLVTMLHSDRWYDEIRILFFLFFSLFKIGSTNECELILFDFTVSQNVSGWYEVSDTVRNVGKSKATIILQKTQGMFN